MCQTRNLHCPLQQWFLNVFSAAPPFCSPPHINTFTATAPKGVPPLTLRTTAVQLYPFAAEVQQGQNPGRFWSPTPGHIRNQQSFTPVVRAEKNTLTPCCKAGAPSTPPPRGPSVGFFFIALFKQRFSQLCFTPRLCKYWVLSTEYCLKELCVALIKVLHMKYCSTNICMTVLCFIGFTVDMHRPGLISTTEVPAEYLSTACVACS